MKRFAFLLFATAATGLAMPAMGAMVANDDASTAAYQADDGNPANDTDPADNTNGWVVGDNGGSGFNAWSTINNESSSGFGGGFIDSSTADDIGTGTADESFGVFGNDVGVGQAIRPFVGSLSVGQTFSIAMDNQSIDNGGTVGFGLRNTSGEDRLEFFFVGGQNDYTVNDNTGPADSGVGFTTDGLNLDVTVTAADSYSIDITPLGGSTTTLSGTLAGTSGTGIDRVRLFNADGGDDVFFNSLAIVPEPASLALAGVGGLLLVGRRRRRE